MGHELLHLPHRRFRVASIATSIATGYALGGPLEVAWTWIIASVFTVITGIAMAEMCSSYPTAGSVYNWAGLMAPPAWAPLASYVTGWLNLLGNVAGDATFAWGFAQLCAGPAGDPTHNINQQVGIAIGVCVFWAVVNVLRVDQQGWLNNLAAFIQTAGTLVIFIVMLSMGAKNNTLSPSYWVWTLWYNNSGWSGVDGYVALMGMIGALFSFAGYEAGAHLAEETRGARTAAPRGLVMTCVGGSIIGFLYIMALLYNAPNPSGATSDDQVTVDDQQLAAGQAWIQSAYSIEYLYTRAAGPAGGKGLTAITLIAIFMAGISFLTVTSRIANAMARDGALPGSVILRYVWPLTKSPVWTVVLILVLDIAIICLPLGSTSALFAITGVAVVCYQWSYMIPLLLRVTTAALRLEMMSARESTALIPQEQNPLQKVSPKASSSANVV